MTLRGLLPCRHPASTSTRSRDFHHPAPDAGVTPRATRLQVHRRPGPILVATRAPTVMPTDLPKIGKGCGMRYEETHLWLTFRHAAQPDLCGRSRGS